jgi:hypothetical protein
VLNEVVFARSTFVRSVLVPESALPDVNIQGYASPGNASNLPQEFSNTYYQVLDNVSLILGKHNIRVGLNALWNTSSGYAFFQGRGVYSFQPLPADFGAPDGLTNFRLGRAASFQATQGDFERSFRNWDLSFYGQDDWRVSPRLTLNLGLRCELQLPPTVKAVKTGRQVSEAFDPQRFVRRFISSLGSGASAYSKKSERAIRNRSISLSSSAVLVMGAGKRAKVWPSITEASKKGKGMVIRLLLLLG